MGRTQIDSINLLKSSVAVCSLQAVVHPRSSRDMSQTVHINSHFFLSRVRISVRPSTFFIGGNSKKNRSVQLIAMSCLTTFGAAVAVY